jgi:hypothetical protein
VKAIGVNQRTDENPIATAAYRFNREEKRSGPRG